MEKKTFSPGLFGAAVLALAFVAGCGESYAQKNAAYPPSGYPSANVGATTTALAAPVPAEAAAANDDSRFEGDGDEGAPAPPPPKPVRQIDREGTDKPPVAAKANIDRTPGDGTTDGNAGGGGGGAAGGQPQSPVSAEVHGTEYLIYTAHLTMAVYQVGQGLDAIERIGRDAGGYLSLKTDREVTIRIPRQRFDETLKRVEGSGDVLHREVRAQDVTDEFLDLETRLKNARAMRQRLQELLAKAAVKEALDIEKELGRVTEEIESMEGKLKLLRDRIAFSTITVTFEARGAAVVQTTPRLPFPWLSTLGLPRLLSLY